MAKPNNALLAELTRIKSGDRLKKVLTASRLNAIQDAIRSLIESHREIARSSPPAPRRLLHPFQIIDLGVPVNESAKRKVEVAWGTITPMADSEAEVAISGLDTAITLEEGHKIWIKVAFDPDGEVLSCSLDKGVPTAAGWTGYPARYEYAGSSTWNYWFHPIAEVRSAKTGKASTTGNDPGEYSLIDDFVIAQLTNTHLVVQEMCDNGNKIFVLAPGPGATSTAAP